MKSAIQGVVLTTLLLLSFWSLAAGANKARPPVAKPVAATPSAAPAWQGDPVVGREKADAERCIECHGIDGQGQGHSNGPEGKFARLAGQDVAYFLKQIRDFRSGARKHDQMAIMARSITDEDAADIASYFAGLPAMKGDAKDVSAVGRTLYEQGDAARGVVSCASCHGLGGRGSKDQPLAPPIAGQEWRYLDKQLRDWRSGDRRNSAGQVMNAVTRALTDAEIEALATHLSGLSGP